MTSRMTLLLACGAAFILWIASGSLYMVEQGQQALVIRLGKPLGVAGQPGIKAKIPLIDTVIFYENRILPVETPAEQVILGGQKRLEVETYTQFRIIDPLKFYQSLHTVEQARLQLTQIVSASLRRRLGQVLLSAILSPQRAAIVIDIQDQVVSEARPLGIEILAVYLRRADLPYETSQAIFDRMKSERNREAKQLRAEGVEWAQQIKSQAERDRTVMLSEADRNSRIVHGEADAAVNKLLGDAYRVDPAFYRFYRSLQIYRQSLAAASPTLMLSPDAAFLSVLRSGPPAFPDRKDEGAAR